MDDIREKAQVKLLDRIQDSIEQSISNWEVVTTEDLFDEETDSVLRAFTFSRGTREFLVIVNPTFGIPYQSKKCNTDLLTQIFNVLNQLMWKVMNGGLAVTNPLPKKGRYR